MSQRQRDRSITAFRDNKDVCVMLSTKSGAEGLNLALANRVNIV
jgi:SNF2 family DNA or RNA helicase